MPRDAPVFPHRWRDLAKVGFDETMWEAACSRCKALRGSPEERDTLTLVRQIRFEFMEQHRPNDSFAPGLEAVAASLHCSPRTQIGRRSAPLARRRVA